MAIKYISDPYFVEQVKDKKVLLRVDFNVPLKKDGVEISDPTRIDEALPTLKYLLEKGAKKVVVMSHFGRPNGEVNKKYSLLPVANYLAEKLQESVVLTETALDRGIKTLLNLNEARVILLENLRFHPEEEKNDREFARELSKYGDLFVFEAFGAAHRKHASTYEINVIFKNKAFGGFLLEKEVNAMEKIVNHPKAPFMAIVGGAKVSDKIKIIERLLVLVEKLFIGGAMAYPFLKAEGKTVGKSLCSDDDVLLAKKILALPSAKNKLVLPLDHVVSETLDGKPKVIDQIDIPESLIGLDIGPRTLAHYGDFLKRAETVLWNGPMGLFENEHYSQGTFGVAKILSESSAYTVVGGGDSVSALKKSGREDKISHVSTGGGASLEFIEEGTLPGIQALKFGLN